MIAEETPSSTPGGEPPPSERDLLAERRARRAAQAGEDPALLRRAEAAEATVQTLETHLSSLRQRLREAEEERRRSAERLAANENELRRVKQQEYAEQQLRVEAERTLAAATDPRLLDLRSAGALARSEIVQRLQARVAEVERRAAQLAEEIESERRARERTERALETMRESHAAMAATVGELRDVARKLRHAASASAHRPSAAAVTPPPAPPEQPSQARREEMADALAAAVERLRARAEESVPADQAPAIAPSVDASGGEGLAAATHEHGGQATPSAGAPRAEASTTEALPTLTEPATKAKPHKHSMSLIARLRAARKHRRKAR
jgi:translation initiation factor IF-2